MAAQPDVPREAAVVAEWLVCCRHLARLTSMTASEALRQAYDVFKPSETPVASLFAPSDAGLRLSVFPGSAARRPGSVMLGFALTACSPQANVKRDTNYSRL